MKMKKYGVTTPEKLRMLCIENDWFTCGSNRQYEKMFQANELLAPIEEIATIIWLCSDDEIHCRRDILETLIEAHKEHILNAIAENGDNERLLTETVEEVYNGYFD
jgi:hypothetical protein